MLVFGIDTQGSVCGIRAVANSNSQRILSLMSLVFIARLRFTKWLTAQYIQTITYHQHVYASLVLFIARHSARVRAVIWFESVASCGGALRGGTIAWMNGFAHVVVDEGDGYVRICFPSQRVDGHAVRELYELAVGLEARSRLLVDFSDVPHVPSGMLGMLATIRKKFLTTGCKLHVLAPDPQVYEMFTITHLDRILNVFRDKDEAVARF